MAVVNDYFAGIAERALLKQIVSGLVTRVPGCLIVYEHVYVPAASGLRDSECIAIANGERLFHHDVDAVPGALFKHLAVIEGVCVDEDGGGMSASDHVGEGSEVKGRIELMLLRVSIEKLPVRFRDPDDLDVGAFQCSVEEARDMAMREPDYADAKSRRRRLRACLERNDKEDES